jgi:hypothetical protein
MRRVQWLIGKWLLNTKLPSIAMFAAFKVLNRKGGLFEKRVWAGIRTIRKAGGATYSFPV